jgi:hypothetical protein
MKKVVVLIGAMLIGSLIFQNCGGLEGLSSSNSSVADSPPVTGNENDGVDDPIPPAPANDPLYLAGEAFNPSRMTRNIANAEFTAELVNYIGGDEAYRTVAVNEDGDGLAVKTSHSEVASQQEWDRVILERCQLQTGKPCALVASGLFFAINEAELAANYVDQFANLPTTFSGNVVPGRLDAQRAGADAEYPRLIAANSGSFHSYWFSHNGSAGIGWSEVSQEMANRWGKEHCETINLGAEPCILFAQGLDIVWNPMNSVVPDLSVVFGPRPLQGADDLILVPNANGASDQLADAIALHQANPNNYHFLVIYSRFGNNFRIRTSTTPFSEAQKQAAVDECTQERTPEANGHLRRCFLYADNMTVVLTADDYGAASHHWHASLGR